MKTSTVKKSGLPPESTGIMRISLWADDFVKIENCSAVEDIRLECIKVTKNKHILAVNGENLTVEEFEGNNLSINGKISSIEYLT